MSVHDSEIVGILVGGLAKAKPLGLFDIVPELIISGEDLLQFFACKTLRGWGKNSNGQFPNVIRLSSRVGQVVGDADCGHDTRKTQSVLVSGLTVGTVIAHDIAAVKQLGPCVAASKGSHNDSPVTPVRLTLNCFSWPVHITHG